MALLQYLLWLKRSHLFLLWLQVLQIELSLCSWILLAIWCILITLFVPWSSMGPSWSSGILLSILVSLGLFSDSRFTFVFSEFMKLKTFISSPVFATSGQPLLYDDIFYSSCCVSTLIQFGILKRPYRHTNKIRKLVVEKLLLSLIAWNIP